MKENNLKNDFLKRLRNWMEKRGREESKLLLGELLEWGTAVLEHDSSDFSIFDAVQERITNSVKKTKKSKEELLNHFFESNDHDTWILRFKLLGTTEKG